MFFKKSIFGWLVGLALLLLPSAVVLAEANLVAQVGVIPVTGFELQREVQKILPLQVSFHGGLSAQKLKTIRQQALDKLIERAYKVQYALTEEIVVDNAAVEQELEPLRAKFPTRQGFEKALGDEGLNGYRASMYRQLLADRAEKVAVSDRITVSDADVAKFFEKHKETYLRPKQFKASHILIRVDPASNADERQALKVKAEELLKKAEAGEDFYNLAYYNSDDRSKYVGGDLGYFHVGQTVKEFENALLDMKPGEVSGPVTTMYGHHIIKLDEVNEPRQLSFEEVSGTIRQTLLKKQRDGFYREWMGELEAKYQVQNFEQ